MLFGPKYLGSECPWIFIQITKWTILGLPFDWTRLRKNISASTDALLHYIISKYFYY